MPNQTPHTPQNQTPSPADERVTFAMKAPVFPKEMLEKFEQTKAMKFSEKTIKEVNELLIQSELKKQQNQQSEYIEINGIRLETENLGIPTHPQIQILKKGDKIIEGRPYCWNNGDDWYYNWYAAMIESRRLGKRLPTDEELSQLFGSEKDIELTKEEFEEVMKKLNLKLIGNWVDGIFRSFDMGVGLWTSTRSKNNGARGRVLNFSFNSVVRNRRNTSTRGFSVRCIFPEKEEEKKSDVKKTIIVKIRNKISDTLFKI